MSADVCPVRFLACVQLEEEQSPADGMVKQQVRSAGFSSGQRRNWSRVNWLLSVYFVKEERNRSTQQ